jgi:CheY-like chemotaxis protein
MTAEPESAGPLICAPAKTIHILFVDDDPILREFAVANLAGEFAEVATAAGREAALRAVAGRRPDIVLVALEAPGYDALAVLEAMRVDPRCRDIPVIALTGREDIEAVDAAFAAGAAAFVVKPLNWRLLGRQVRFVLRATASQMSAAPGQGVAAEQLVALAREGVRFIAQAMAIDPSLKAVAVPFAEAADAALEPTPARGAR